MPLTPKGKKIKAAMTKEYGDKKGEEVFYASINKGTITGAHQEKHRGLGMKQDMTAKKKQVKKGKGK